LRFHEFSITDRHGADWDLVKQVEINLFRRYIGHNNLALIRHINEELSWNSVIIIRFILSTI